MKISKKRLIKLINEVFMGIVTRNELDVISKSDDWNDPNTSGQSGVDVNNELMNDKQYVEDEEGFKTYSKKHLDMHRRQRRSLGNYHRSKNTEKRFNKYYDAVFVEGDGYLAPVYGGSSQALDKIFGDMEEKPAFSVELNDRVMFISLDSSLADNVLRNVGFSDERIDMDINRQIDTVIIPISSNMTKGFFATPWLIFHSMLDSPQTLSLPVFIDLGPSVYFDDDGDITISFQEFEEDVLEEALDALPLGITSSSGVEKTNVGGFDSFSEMVLQSLFNVGPSSKSIKKEPLLGSLGRGASFNPQVYNTLSPEAQRVIDKTIDIANQCANVLRENLKGKIVVVEV
jgi:hypothetical protein